jgi:CPA1 family monovalent cation:H+ antiporter
VIAAVTVGVYLGWRTPQLVKPSTRLQLYSVWEMLQFMLNAVLFVLIGLQLPTIIGALDGTSATTLIGQAALVSGAVILLRIVWVFVVMLVPRGSRNCLRGRGEGRPPPSHVAVVAWSGMRGGVALAAALAIPLTVAGGSPFPNRDLVIYLAFATILVTLVVQGITLPWLIRALGVEPDHSDGQEELAARMSAADAALARVEELREVDWTYEDTLERVRAMFDYRRRRFAAQVDGNGHESYEERSSQYVAVMLEAIGAQRNALLELRDAGRIGDEVMRRVERELDLEESRLAG